MWDFHTGTRIDNCLLYDIIVFRNKRKGLCIMIYLIIFAILMFLMFAMNPELIMLVVMMVIFLPILGIIGANQEAKEKRKRNAAYSAQCGKKMKLMTVYSDQKKEDIIRNEDGTVSGEIRFSARESQVFSHSYRPAEAVYRGVSIGGIHVGNTTVTPGGVVSKNHRTTKGYVEAYRFSKSYTVDKVELSPEVCEIYASDPLFRRYVKDRMILCNNGKEYTDAELTAWSRLDYYRQAEYAALLVNSKCIDYGACKDIVTLLNRIHDGMTPDEMRQQQKRGGKMLAGLFLGLFLLVAGTLVALGPFMLEDEILGGLSGTYMDLDPTFFDGERYSIKFRHERSGDEQTLVVNGSEYDVYVKGETWTKVEITGGELRYLPFPDPIILKYKWIGQKAVATKLLDSEGNVLWSTIPEDRYNRANAMMEQGRYMDAAFAFQALNGYKDSAEKLKECEQIMMANETAALDKQYAEAAALMESGKYEEAIAAFEALDGHKDSASQIEACKTALMEDQYNAADTLAAEGKTAEAAIAFSKLGNYRDSRERCIALWAETRKETISAGNYHTVGVCNDGTVVAVGDNRYGQCDVSGWTDIVSVSAGFYHTIGLRNDGTVVAAGPNDYGQCNVSNWTDIVAVSAGANHTVGLRSDGTVVAAGDNGEDVCSVDDWTDIVAIAAGGAHTVGLRSDGTVVATGWNSDGQCDVSNWKDIVAISAGHFHTAGLRSNGTVTAIGDDWGNALEVGGWTDIVTICTGDSHTAGIRSDGTVVATRKYKNDREIIGWSDIVAISAGEHHTVGLRSNGTVIAVRNSVKDSNKGQCDVSSWTNIKLPE